MGHIMHDTNNYAEGSRARKIIRYVFAPILRKAVAALLWLCPDEVIVANAKLNVKGEALHITNGQRALIVRTEIKNANVALWKDLFK